MAGGKGVKNKQKVKTARKAAPKAAKSKKTAKAPRKMPNAGQKKKTVKTGKNTSKVCKAPKTPKPKTATPGKKIMGAKQTAIRNVGVGPSSKPIKKETIKVQASGAIPGTSQNTGQATKKTAPKRKLDQPKQVCKTPKTPKPKRATTPGKENMGAKPTTVTNLGVEPSSKPIKKETIKEQASGAIPGTSQNIGQATKKRAPKRKLDQPKQVCKAPKTPKPKRATTPGKKIMGAKQTAITNLGVGPSSKSIKKEIIKVQASGAIPGTSQNTGQATKKRAPKRKLDQPKQATPSIKKKTINIPKPEMPHSVDKDSICINMAQPVQTIPPAFHYTVPVQQHHHYHQMKSVTLSEKPKEEPPSNSEASSSSAPEPREKHFVDKHEEALIARCASVSPILDGLKSKGLLEDEQYDTIRAEKTSQEKMRELYKIVRGFSKSDKDTFYEILKKNNGPLVNDLENS